MRGFTRSGLMGRAPFLSPFWAIPIGCGAISESTSLYAYIMYIIRRGMSRACVDGLNWQPFSRCRDQRLRAVVVVGRRGAVPPDRPRPSGIANNPRDNMQVKLAHDVAKRADIDFIRFHVTLQESHGPTRFLHQL